MDDLWKQEDFEIDLPKIQVRPMKFEPILILKNLKANYFGNC